MSEFEEELSNLPVSIITNYGDYWNKAQLLTVFKNWRSPEHIEKEVQMKLLEAKREKLKLFYLKNKLTGMYLYKKPLGGYGEEPTSSIKKYLTDDFKFTQEEIDSMQTGSYELVPVEDGE